MTEELKTRIVKALRIGAREARINSDREECGELIMLLTEHPHAVAPAPEVVGEVIMISGPPVPSIFEGSEAAQATVVEATEKAYKRANKRTEE